MDLKKKQKFPLRSKITLPHSAGHIFRATGKPSIRVVIFEAKKGIRSIGKVWSWCLIFQLEILDEWLRGAGVSQTILIVLNYLGMNRVYRNKNDYELED